MLGLGWTEMLVIGVVALIVIGPKDLPVVMGRIGKIIGQVQRMGREFQREINKTTGLDEVRNLRTSITSPLKKTAEEIRKDFNAIGKDGKEQPSGALKPTDPAKESVVDAIQQQAGMAPAKKSNDELAADYGFKSAKTEPASVEPAKAEPIKAARAPSKAATAKTATAKSAARSASPAGTKSAPRPRTSSSKAATSAPLAEAEPVAPVPGTAEPKAPKPVRRAAAPKTAAARATKAAQPAGDAPAKPATKPRAPRRKPADTAGKSE